jgi:hypothetical protein
MEIFGFPCQAISVFKLQEAFYGVLQRREANTHSAEKKIALSFVTGFLFCEPFYEPQFVFSGNFEKPSAK